MGYNTKIDWCDTSWNPVTGCLHGCEYCYARGIANRFGGDMEERKIIPPRSDIEAMNEPIRTCRAVIHDLEKPWVVRSKKDGSPKVSPYPFNFDPTLHRYRLNQPKEWTEPRTIFVCSMADLFGSWVPDEWIKEVFDACRAAPQHRYLFLTKNPNRYDQLEDAGLITPKDRNFWLGSTVTDLNRDRLHWSRSLYTFMSCEPMLAPWNPAGKPNEKYRGGWPKWVIFGAETGNRKDKVVPKKEWIDNAVQMCRNIGAAVFMKESLRGIMGDDFVQEFPWGFRSNG